MIKLIARKELLELWRDGRLRWAAGLLLLLLLVSLWSGWRHYRRVSAEHEAVRQSERARWLNQGARHPHTAAHYGTYVFKPLLPLSVVDAGITPYVGVTAHLEAHERNIFQYKPAEDAPTVRRFGELTAALTLQMLIPLLLILLLFTAFVGEREQGTLRLLLSLGVKRRDLALGKIAGLALPLLLLLAPVVVLGIVALWLNAGSLAIRLTWGRLALMALSYLLYFGVIIGLTLSVSARAGSARQALVVLLGFWFLNCLAAPQVVTDLAALLHPTPSSLEFVAALRAELQQQKQIGELTTEYRARLVKEYSVSSAEELPISPDGLALVENEEIGDRIQERHFNQLWNTYERQERLYQAGALFAPMLAVQSLSMSLAGTDLPQQRHFVEAAETYRQDLVQSLNRYVVEHDTSANRQQHPYVKSLKIFLANNDLWAQMKPFEYRAPGLGWVLRRRWVSLSLLLIWLAGAVWLTYRAVARVEVS
jgi:ABC-2 type transport system permease protein